MLMKLFKSGFVNLELGLSNNNLTKIILQFVRKSKFIYGAI